MKEDTWVVCQQFGDSGFRPRFVGKSQPHEDGKLGLYEHPAMALSFDDEAKAQAFMKDVCNFGDEGKVLGFAAACEAWDVEVVSGFFVRNFNKVAPELKATICTTGDLTAKQKELLNWWLNVYVPDVTNVPQELYMERSELVYKLFKYLGFSGYWVESQQSCASILRFKMPKKEELAEVAAEIELTLPYIKSVRKDSNSYTAQVFKINEHSCSEGGSYYLSFNECSLILNT